MSDYHPDGGQLFFPKVPDTSTSQLNMGNGKEELCDEFLFPMFACLGKSTYGDNIRYRL